MRIKPCSSNLLLLSLSSLLLLSIYLQLTEKSRTWHKITTAYTLSMIYYSANLNRLTHINDFEQILKLSFILQNSQNWMVSNEPQEHIKHETDKILTQKKD